MNPTTSESISAASAPSAGDSKSVAAFKKFDTYPWGKDRSFLVGSSI